jgi:H+-transporting ATPase
LSEEGTNDNDDEGKEETKEEGKDDKDKDNSKAKDVSSKITVNGEVDPSERDGLTTEQAEELYKTVGFNELPTIDIPIWWVFLEQYTGTMPYMLELAVIIAGAVEDWIDFGIIIAIVSIIIP